MYISDDFRDWCFTILADDTFQQIAPLVFLLLIPLFVLVLATTARRSSLLYSIAMGLDSLGLGLPWNWSNSSASDSSKGASEKRKTKKKHPRTRAEQIALNGTAKHGSDDENAPDEYYPGLVNISGTYCFMNSTLQAMSSLCYLQPHIDAIHAKAEALDVPSPVIDALQALFDELNTPNPRYTSIRPIPMINVLTEHSQDRSNSLMCSREHQDAQELFQLLSECIKNEIAAVDKEGYRDRGLGGLSQTSETNREIGKSVFDGLTANRRSCVECGYTEAVMHFPFDNWQLSVPSASVCRLEDCLADYTRLELLTDCICRKCSMLATHRRLVQESEKLAEATKPEAKPSASKKKRAKDVAKMEARVKTALAQGRIEEDLKDVRMEKVFSKASTKQAMIARPPPVLALHINRSYYGHMASKNNVHIIFPEVLDLTPFTTSGNLSTVPSVPMSTPPPSIPRSTTPTPATYATPRTIYRLTSVVCHYGTHSFGHYICYRRKPRPKSAGAKRWAPPRLADSLGDEPDENNGENADGDAGIVWEDEDPSQHRPGKGWLRISDDSVRECGVETVLKEGSGAFMLYYERVIQARPGVYPLRNSPRSSEETLKPEVLTVQLNGSASSLVSEVGVGVLRKEEERKMGASVNGIGLGMGMGGSQVLGPRVVRSVAAGRGRSLSATPSERGSSVMSDSIEIPRKRGEGSLPNGDSHRHSTSAPSAEYPKATAGLLSSSVPSLHVSRPFARQMGSSISSLSSSTISLSSSLSSLSSTSSSSSSDSHHSRSPPSPHTHSSKPSHPPASPSHIVGLKA